jgi:hypothetical protein
MPIRDFSSLNKYGRREYKFVQEGTFGKVNAENMGERFNPELVSGGICLGVTLVWIKERLETSNGLFRRNGPFRATTARQFSTPLNPFTRLSRGLSPPKGSLLSKFIGKGKSHVRNQQAMLDGAWVQLDYLEKRDTSMAADKIGLVACTHQPPDPSIRKSKHNLPERVQDVTISDAARSLPQGSAMTIELRQPLKPDQERRGGGHMVAFYRSHGGTLHFFDPNAGVYQIHGESSILEFVKAWLDVYVKNDAIQWETHEDDWCRVFNRTNS